MAIGFILSKGTEMTRRIQEDQKEFRDIVSGKIDSEIRRFIKHGKMIARRPRGGKFLINVPQINLPVFHFGSKKTGWGRGEGDVGDVVSRNRKKGQGNKAGSDPGDVIPVAIDLKYVLNVLQDELELPNLEPKDSSQIFQEKIVYTGIKKVGPESLRHVRRTMKQAMMRMIQTGEYDENNPNLIPIQDDMRYRSWKIRHEPESNAVIFFARDWSGSMDDEKCEIVSNTSWWIDQWIRQFYKTTETVYIGHDTEAKEIDHDKFYKYRYGGGTKCSSAIELIIDKIKNVYNPSAWNIYVFYFTDGENASSDFELFNELIKSVDSNVNLIGIGQILCYDQEDNVLSHMQSILPNTKNIRTFNLSKSGTASAVAPEFAMIREFLKKKD